MVAAVTSMVPKRITYPTSGKELQANKTAKWHNKYMFKPSDLFRTGSEEGGKLIEKLVSCLEEVSKFSGLVARIRKKKKQKMFVF